MSLNRRGCRVVESARSSPCGRCRESTQSLFNVRCVRQKSFLCRVTIFAFCAQTDNAVNGKRRKREKRPKTTMAPEDSKSIHWHIDVPLPWDVCIAHVVDTLKVADSYPKHTITSLKRTCDEHGDPFDVLFVTSQVNGDHAPAFIKPFAKALGIATVCRAASKIIIDHHRKHMLLVGENETAAAFIKVQGRILFEPHPEPEKQLCNTHIVTEVRMLSPHVPQGLRHQCLLNAENMMQGYVRYFVGQVGVAPLSPA
jgi:hypothetical protein